MERDTINSARQAADFLRDQLDMVVCRSVSGWDVLTGDGSELSFDGDEELIAFARAEREALAQVGGLGADPANGSLLPPACFQRRSFVTSSCSETERRCQST